MLDLSRSGPSFGGTSCGVKTPAWPDAQIKLINRRTRSPESNHSQCGGSSGGKTGLAEDDPAEFKSYHPPPPPPEPTSKSSSQTKMLFSSPRLLACIAVAVLAHLRIATAKYMLQDDYEGLSFFSKFNFITVWMSRLPITICDLSY